MVAAADGTALEAFRPVIDALRSRVPSKFDCVVDAALTSEVVAVAFGPATGATIVIITRAHVARCAALSRIANDMFVATIGASTLAETPAASPLGDSRWSRARSYLLGDPIAIAIEREGERVLAVAQPKPLDGWLTIDAAGLAPIERGIRTWIDRQRSTSLTAFAGNLSVTVRGSQLLMSSKKLRADELGNAITDVLRTFDAPASATPAAFTCPPPSDGIVRCSGNHVIVTTLATTLRKLVDADTEPAIAGGDVIGIRLTEDPEVLLRRGDIILGLDGHRITSAEQLHELARYLTDRTVLAIRRDGADLVIELSE